MNTQPTIDMSMTTGSGGVCETCNGRGELGGWSGQTAESASWDSVPCPDCDRHDVLAVLEAVLADMARDGLALDMHYEGIDKARAAVAELIAAGKAARQFIENGIELGYIRLPDPPDPALNTLPKLVAALAAMVSP